MSEDAEEEVRSGLVVIDPDASSRTQAESLEEALARPILAVDPSEFKPAESEEIQGAAGFVVCWDLGFRSGAELLEEIRSDEALKDRKVLISMDAPTRSRVLLAMLLGADGVCHRPYDESELASFLERVGLGRSAAAE